MVPLLVDVMVVVFDCGLGLGICSLGLGLAKWSCLHHWDGLVAKSKLSE